MLALPKEKNISDSAFSLGIDEESEANILYGIENGESVIAYVNRGVVAGLIHYKIIERTLILYRIYGKDGVKIQLYKHLFNISNIDEIIHRSNKENEGVNNFYRKVLGVFPIFDNLGEYVYCISLRKRNFDDYYNTPLRSARLKGLDSLVGELNEVCDKGTMLYDYYNCAEYSQVWEKDKRFFSTFWGASMAGKSTIPRLLMETSKIQETYDPFFTLLSDGVVLVGTYPAHVRTSGPDTIKDLDSIKDVVRALWRFDDVRCVIIEGLIAQQQTMIEFYRDLSKNVSERELYFCYFNITLDLIEQRLYDLRGKYIHEYTNRGANIIGCHTRAQQVAENLQDDSDFHVIELNTTDFTQEEMFQQYQNAVGLY